MLEPVIILKNLPEGVLGYTDGRRRIWLDRQQSAASARTALDHELMHLARGHHGHCNDRLEREIDLHVARGLIHLDDLGEAAAWSPHPWEIAEELDVLPDTVVDRIDSLTDEERAKLAARLVDAHWTD